MISLIAFIKKEIDSNIQYKENVIGNNKVSFYFYTDVNKYINLNDNVIEDYNNLDNIQEAVRCFSEHIKRGCAVGILVDTDP